MELLITMETDVYNKSVLSTLLYSKILKTKRKGHVITVSVLMVLTSVSKHNHPIPS